MPSYINEHINSLGKEVTLTIKDGLIVEIDVDVGTYFFAYGETPFDWIIPEMPKADWVIPSTLVDEFNAGEYVQHFCV